jgi:hypothetical protein
MQQRIRSRPHSFEDQIATEKARCEQARLQKGALIKKIRQLTTANHMNDWLRSPGLKSPE